MGDGLALVVLDLVRPKVAVFGLEDLHVCLVRHEFARGEADERADEAFLFWGLPENVEEKGQVVDLAEGREGLEDLVAHAGLLRRAGDFAESGKEAVHATVPQNGHREPGLFDVAPRDELHHLLDNAVVGEPDQLAACELGLDPRTERLLHQRGHHGEVPVLERRLRREGRQNLGGSRIVGRNGRGAKTQRGFESLAAFGVLDVGERGFEGGFGLRTGDVLEAVARGVEEFLRGLVCEQGGQLGDGGCRALVAEFLAGGDLVVDAVLLQHREEFRLGHLKGRHLQLRGEECERPRDHRADKKFLQCHGISSLFVI